MSLGSRRVRQSPQSIPPARFCSLGEEECGICAACLTTLSFSEPALSNLGLPFCSFDHSKAHYYRYDEQLSLCLERLR